MLLLLLRVLDFSLLSLLLLRVLGGGGLLEAFVEVRRELMVDEAVEEVRSTALAFTTFTSSFFAVPRFPGAGLEGVFAFTTSTFTLADVVVDEAAEAFDSVLLDFASDLDSFC